MSIADRGQAGAYVHELPHSLLGDPLRRALVKPRLGQGQSLISGTALKIGSAARTSVSK